MGFRSRGRNDLARWRRLTLAREFALPEVVAKAMRDPQCLPSLMLGLVMQSRVISTKAAISYAHEVTCSMQAGVTDIPRFFDAQLPAGAFLMRPRDNGAPKRLMRAKGRPGRDILGLGLEITSQLYEVVWPVRPKLSVRLGLVGFASCSAHAVLLRWFVHGFSALWDAMMVEHWAWSIGFGRVQEAQRQGHCAWACQTWFRLLLRE